MTSSPSPFEKRKQLHKLIDGLALSCDRKLTDDQANEYFRHLIHYPIEVIGLAMDNLARAATPGGDGFRAVPMVGEIIREVRGILAERVTHAIPAWCDTCRGTGLVIVESPDRQPIVYRCDCRNGEKRDRTIRSWGDVRERYESGFDVFPVKLPLVTMFTMPDLDDSQVFEDGVEVAKVCAVCNQTYNFRHESRITAVELKIFHASPAECQSCYVERGRKAGMWT